jgi:hypothetical protein
MDKDLIENHKKNLESLEKLKLKTTDTELKLKTTEMKLKTTDTEKEIKFKKLKKIEFDNSNNNSININNLLFYIKNSYKILYLPTKYIYLFSLSLVLFFLVYEKNVSFKQVYDNVENKNIL